MSPLKKVTPKVRHMRQLPETDGISQKLKLLQERHYNNEISRRRDNNSPSESEGGKVKLPEISIKHKHYNQNHLMVEKEHEMANELGSIVDSYSSVRGGGDSVHRGGVVETDDAFGPLPIN